MFVKHISVLKTTFMRKKLLLGNNHFFFKSCLKKLLIVHDFKLKINLSKYIKVTFKELELEEVNNKLACRSMTWCEGV